MRNRFTDLGTATALRAANLTLLKLLAVLALLAVLSSCASTMVRNPVPGDLASRATAMGMQDVRFWGDETPPNLNAAIKEKYGQMRSTRPHLVRAGARSTLSYLTISGGGGEGAFAAGLLTGWSLRGDRPEFEIVTGVSTGALIAPFAFLGSRYDATIKAMYTDFGTKELIRERPIQGLLGGASLASNKPLARVIAEMVDDKLLAEIAAAHKTGRRLLVGTTNLDAQRPVIWDMGEIAAAGHPQAAQLFRDILLASAAIPGVFPPVFISVEADGTTYDEMHVDGGTTNQVFLMPNQLAVGRVDKIAKLRMRRRVFVIRNGRVTPEHKAVKAKTFSIAQRSLSTLIKNQGLGDLYELYDFARKNRLQYRLAYIPGDFPDTSTEPFDTVYQSKLFDLGKQLAQSGYKWHRKPPSGGPVKTRR